MKKLKIVLGCIAATLAATGMAACADVGDPNDGNLPGGNVSTYTVRFENAAGESPSEQSVSAGELAVRPADPERVGYTFDGWYRDGVLYEFTAAVDSDITLVAKYTSVLGGEGTAADPYTIDNAEELKLLKTYLDSDAAGFRAAKYVQTADIVWSSASPIAAFDGEYDGGGHSLQIESPLFDKLTGKVTDLNVAGSITASGEYSGMLANVAQNANITRVTASGDISNAVGSVGGLVGSLNNGRIEYCETTAHVFGSVAGGLVGVNSGVVINSVVGGSVTAGDTAGGAVGILSAGGLVQNVGGGTVMIIDVAGETSAFVSSDGVAGGIVGTKHVGSTVYRAFVYGDCVRGKRAGGIVGMIDSDVPSYSDVVECSVLDSLYVDGLEETSCHGVSAVEDFSEINLPAAVWDTTQGGTPVLKSDITLPVAVKVTVDGNASFAVTGSHDNRSEQLFTLAGEHFSKLIELDTDVELKTAPSLYSSYSDSEFLAGNYGLAFAAGGAKLKSSLNADYAPLTYVLTYSYVDSFEYLPNGSDVTEDIDYDAPVDVYTDGKNYYAFVVQKQYIGNGMYAGFLLSFVYKDGEWTFDKDWCPKANFGGGAYKYTFTAQLVYTYSYMIIVDDNYTVDGNDGYYLTRFVMRNLYNDGSYTESAEVISYGQTVMYLGNSESNEGFITAFAFNTDNDGYSDFIYFDEDGNLVNSAGFAVVDASADFLAGRWFDGNNIYEFDTEASTVNVQPKNGAASEHAYTVENGKIKFTADKAYELALVPNVLGSYMLVSKSGGANIVLATYMSDALDGAWITEDGDVIVVMSEPTYVTFNGDAVPTEDAVYNGLQAARFTVDGKEYYLVTSSVDNITMLVYGDVAVYAVSSDKCCTDFADDFVTTVEGEKVTMLVDGNLQVTLGNESAKAVPEVISGDEYVLRVTLGGVKYTLERKYDVVIMTGGDAAYVFTSLSAYNLFTRTSVTTYTNGNETLEITEDGKYRRYSDEASGALDSLTAMYSDERAEYGGEGRGFVLGYTDGDDLYFFYADTDAYNVRLLKASVNSNGEVTAKLVTNFVPHDELAPLFGSYVRKDGDDLYKLTFDTDGTLTYEYPGYFGGSTEEELEWYPLLNYNYKTQTSKIIAYTVEGNYTSLVEPNVMGLGWGVNAYIREELYETLSPYTAKAYIANTTLLTVGATRIELKFLKEKDGVYSNTTALYNYTAVDVNGTTLTITAEEGGIGVTDPRTATLVLAVNGDIRTATLTIGDGEATVYTGEPPLDYNTLIGEYEYDGTTYAFTVEEGLFGSVSVKLTCSKAGSTTKIYTYSTSEGVVVLTDGTQAIGVRNNVYQYLYIRKDGDNLMVCDSLDASAAIKAVDKAVAGMPSIDEIKEMLDGNEYTASDGSTISFELSNSVFGSYFTIIDGDDEIYCDKSGHKFQKGMVTLYFGNDDYGLYGTRVVVVYLNANNDVTKLLVGETDETATKEYAPGFVPPTVDEMKALLLDTGYKAANGKTAMFYEEASWMGTYYMFAHDGNTYDYDSGVYANGEYTFTFKPVVGSTVTVVVTYTAAGVEKLTIAGVDYLPVVLPTTDELMTMLDGKTFTNEYDDSMHITFEVTSSIFGDSQLNAMVFDGEDEEGTEYYSDKITANGKVYTLEFSVGFTKVTMTVTLYPDGTVNFVTLDGDDYYIAET